jgi:transcriptional antiterminator RfaH
MYWAAAQLSRQRERLALHCLGLNGFTVYYPRLRERRLRNGRHVETTPALFPGYGFVAIELQWRAAHYCPGVIRLVMDGLQPARVPDAAIEAIRKRERDGLIELPKQSLVRGQRVRVLRGPFLEAIGLFDGVNGHERVHILLSLLGASRRVTLSKDDVEAM